MAQTVKYEDYLASIDYDPEHAAAYGGVDKLYRAVRKEGKFVLGRTKIRNWLLKKKKTMPYIEKNAASLYAVEWWPLT